MTGRAPSCCRTHPRSSNRSSAIIKRLAVLSGGSVMSHDGRTCADVEGKSKPSGRWQPAPEWWQARWAAMWLLRQVRRSSWSRAVSPKVHKLTEALCSISGWMDGWMEVWFEGVVRTLSTIFFFFLTHAGGAAVAAGGELKLSVCCTFQ